MSFGSEFYSVGAIHKKERSPCITQGPSKIKRREVSWTLTKKVRVSFAGPGQIKRRELVLDPQ